MEDSSIESLIFALIFVSPVLALVIWFWPSRRSVPSVQPDARPTIVGTESGGNAHRTWTKTRYSDGTLCKEIHFYNCGERSHTEDRWYRDDDQHHMVKISAPSWA